MNIINTSLQILISLRTREKLHRTPSIDSIFTIYNYHIGIQEIPCSIIYRLVLYMKIASLSKCVMPNGIIIPESEDRDVNCMLFS